MNFAMRLTCALCLLVLAAAGNAPQAHAAKSAVILPFSVNAPQNYAYLSKAVPTTVQGRLNRPGVLTASLGSGSAASRADAQKKLAASGADSVVWGSVSVVGSECTVEIHSLDKAGKTWSKTGQGPVSSLTGTVQNLTAALGQEVFGVSVMRTPGSTAAGAPRPAASNAEIITNDTGQQQVYLNPQFRYQGAGAHDGSRLRSQRLSHNMVDMPVGDFNRDGALELVVATYESESNRPYTYIYSFKGNTFSQYADRIPYFVSVMRVPPTYTPTLVGQGWDSLKLFSPGVHTMVKTGNKYTLSTRIDLPAGATVFNCAWLPGGRTNKTDQLVMLTDDERLKLFQGTGNTLIHTTMERFSGSATGMDHYKGMPGLGVDKNYQLPSKYFAPMRLIAADIGNTGEYVLLVNKPISTASIMFDRYRYFPQGEIHALYWDGVGLGLKWKTRRIRGSVGEVDLADVNNDGILDLVVGLNTSPDLGIGSRQSMVVAYPLDTSATNPNVPADLSDFEVNPN